MYVQIQVGCRVFYGLDGTLGDDWAEYSMDLSHKRSGGAIGSSGGGLRSSCVNVSTGWETSSLKLVAGRWNGSTRDEVVLVLELILVPL